MTNNLRWLIASCTIHKYYWTNDSKQKDGTHYKVTIHKYYWNNDSKQKDGTRYKVISASSCALMSRMNPQQPKLCARLTKGGLNHSTEREA